MDARCYVGDLGTMGRYGIGSRASDTHGCLLINEARNRIASI